jgi:hypothetical protein
MKEIRVRSLPFGTIFKLAYIASMTSALFALGLVGMLRMFMTFPEPASTSLGLWFFYLVVAPFFSALGFALCGWIGVTLLSKCGGIDFRIAVASDKNA